MTTDTIYALSTPAGGAIAIARISGPEAERTLRNIFTGKICHRYMSHGAVVGENGPVDDAMAVFFRGPNSYTGEDMAEINIHGGYAVIRAVLDAIAAQGLRPAGPGEFTKRAFLNGKMDLSRAEAVMDLVSATAVRSASSALEQLNGALSRRISSMEEKILDALSGVDAAIDYPEELEEDVFSSLPGDISQTKAEADMLIRDGLSSRMVREGARIAIMGRPNAGKSSLFNALLGENRAIVTDIPGTTRDVLEGAITVNGITARLFDTAGLRDARDAAESIGVERAREIVDRADLLLIAIDGGETLTEEEHRLLRHPGRKLAVVNKSDIFSGERIMEEVRKLGAEAVSVSAVTNEGMETLLDKIAIMLAPECESALVTNSRHIAALAEASRALDSAIGAVSAGDPDCVATDLRAALLALGEITGTSVDSQVIDRIFSRFCVGK